MKIGILNTAKDDSAFAAQFVDDGEKFAALLRPIQPNWDFHTYAVKDDVFPKNAAEMDGYIITGSPVSVHAPFPWIERLKVFVRELDQQKRPLFGACFGHQIIAQALGGTVGKNPTGWVLGVEPSQIISPRSWMTPPTKAFDLFAAHEEQVLHLPTNSEIIFQNPNCPIAGFCIQSHIATTQYHPEMSPAFMAGLIVELTGKLPDAVLNKARGQLQSGTDATSMMRWITSFFMQGA